MKRLLVKQLGPWCSYCGGKVRAVYREDAFRDKYACEEHKGLLLEHENMLMKSEQHITEADIQTWYK